MNFCSVIFGIDLEIRYIERLMKIELANGDKKSLKAAVRSTQQLKRNPDIEYK